MYLVEARMNVLQALAAVSLELVLIPLVWLLVWLHHGFLFGALVPHSTDFLLVFLDSSLP